MDETGSGDLDDPSSACARKRIFSQSDVEFDSLVFDRKKINPFSSALSAAPNYHDVNQEYQLEQKPQTHRGFKADEALFNPFKIKEFVPTFGQQRQTSLIAKPCDNQSNSSFSGACGIPTFSESLTLNDGTTIQNTNWKTSAPEFVPKDLNHLTA